VEHVDPQQLYLPLKLATLDARARQLIVRPVGTAPDALAEPVRRVMQAVVAGVPFADVRPMRSSLDGE
jgi:hypothetical protein